MKLNIKVFLIVLVSTLVCEGSIYFFTQRELRKGLSQFVIDDGLLEVKQLTNEFRDAFANRNKNVLLAILQEAKTGTGGVYALAYDPNGVVLAQTKAVIKWEVLETKQAMVRTRIFNSEPIVDIFVPIWAPRENPERLGSVRLGIPMRYALATEKRIFREMWVIILVTGLATMFLMLFFSENILKRVRRLNAETLRIRSGEYGTVVPIVSHDEISELGRNFNAMSLTLRETTVSKEILKESEERYRQLADRLRFQNILLHTQQEVSLDGILAVDAAGRKNLPQSTVCKDVESLPAELLANYDDAPTLEYVKSQVANPEMFLAKIKYLYEYRNETSQDEILLCDGRVLDRYSAPMFGPDQIYYGRVWSFRDITERKRIEQQMILISSALEQASEAVVITDRSGTILYVNPAFERVTGYSRGETLGKNPRLLKSGQHPADFYSQMWSTLLKGLMWEGILVNRRKDGTLYREETSINPVRNDQGQITHFVAVKRDVTERLKMEDMMRQQDKMSAVGKLASGVAHEINNPLAVILGFAQAAIRRLPPNNPLEMPLKSIEQEAVRCKNLVQDLLTFSRVSKAEHEPLDLNRTIEAALSLIMARANMTQIEIRKELTPGLPIVSGNANQLQQVIINLASNALDAMETHGTLTLKTGKGAGRHSVLGLI